MTGHTQRDYDKQMICAPIVAHNTESVQEQFSAARNAPVDLLELRLDYLSTPSNLPNLIAQSPHPLIVTCRAKREGGNFQGSEADRLAILQEALNLEVAYIDVEADCLEKIKPNGITKIIASRHDFSSTPKSLLSIVKDLAALPCDVVKFAVMANSLQDNLTVFAAMQACPKPVIGIAMGEYGEMSRILTRRYGGLLTFGTLAAELKSAPGQLSVSELADLYRVREISAATALYGVVGNPIAQSMSPEIHNSAFAQNNLDAVYLRFRSDDFSTFMREVAEPLGLRGLSVTIPHKTAALEYADEVEKLARDISAVNTLTRLGENNWRGSNTDCHAAVDAILAAAARAGVALKNATALILGAGGTARALACGLHAAGCRVSIANRTRSKAQVLAASLNAEVIDLSEIRAGDFAIIANTTPVGMVPQINATPLAADIFQAGMVAFDAVYNPRETRFLQAAKQAGAEIADGVEMFVGQAARQFETWQAQPAPREQMEEVVLRKLGCGAAQGASRTGIIA